MKRLAGVLALQACAPAHPSDAPDAAIDVQPPIVALVGEVHLHEFPQGGHAWASFVRDPIPLDEMRGSSMTEIDPPVARVAGACALFVLPSCSCAPAEYCVADDRCAPLPAYRWMDAGSIAVTGSALVPLIRMWPAEGTYAADPPPGAQRLFAGGESLAFRGGEGASAFVAELPAPGPVEVVAPDLGADLRVPVSGAFEVRWTVPSDEVVVRVLVSSASRSAWIRCDTAGATSSAIDAALVEGLPPPPRSTRLEVERVEQRIVRTAGGFGVLVHAAQTTWKNGAD